MGQNDFNTSKKSGFVIKNLRFIKIKVLLSLLTKKSLLPYLSNVTKSFSKFDQETSNNPLSVIEGKKTVRRRLRTVKE